MGGGGQPAAGDNSAVGSKGASQQEGPEQVQRPSPSRVAGERAVGRHSNRQVRDGRGQILQDLPGCVRILVSCFLFFFLNLQDDANFTHTLFKNLFGLLHLYLSRLFGLYVTENNIA